MIVIAFGRVIITKRTTLGDLLVFPIEPGSIQEIFIRAGFTPGRLPGESVWEAGAQVMVGSGVEISGVNQVVLSPNESGAALINVESGVKI